MLRKKMLTLLLSLIMSTWSMGQISVQIDQIESCSSPVVVPVTIEDDVTLISLQFTIVWDQPELTLQNTQNPFTSSGILFGTNPDSISFSWFSFSGYEFTAGETLFEMVFDVAGTVGFTYNIEYCLSSDCITPLEAAAPGFVPVPVTPIDGGVTVASNLPSIVCPQDITMNTDPGNCGAIVSWPTPSVVDCDNNTTATPVSSPASGSSFPVGTTAVTVSVQDNSGNMTSCTFDVIVEDNEAPIINCTTPVINVSVPMGTTSTTVTDPGLIPTFSDNCTSPSLSYSFTGDTPGSGTGNANGQTFNAGSTTVTYTVSDGINSNQCQVVVNVTPQVQGAIDVEIVGETLDCGDNFATVQVTVQDDIDLISAQFNVQWPDANLSYNSVSNVLFPSGVLFGPNSSEPYATGDFLTFTWFSSAGVSLNAGDVLFEINFDVTGNPGDCFALNFFETPTPPPPPIEFAAPGFINVPANMIPGQVCIGTSGQVSMNCPTNQVIECGNSTDPSNTGTATASDNCNTVFTITHADQVTNGCGNTQTILRTFSALDPNDIVVATCQQTITVEDNTNPTFDSAPTTLSDINCGDNLPTQETLTASDNCGTAIVVPSVDPFTADLCNGYAVTYRWTATDACNNEAVETVTFNVLPDNQNPIFDSAPAVLADITCGQDLPTQEVLTASDNCGIANVVPSVDPFTADPCNGYAVTYRWTATDACGNEAVETMTFNVLPDNQDPVFDSAPAALADITCGQDLHTQEVLTATDNCDQITVVPSVDSFTADPCNGYAVTYRWTATDACGNEAVETVTFNVLPDNEDPVFDSAPAALSDITCGQDLHSQEVLTATDNCDQITVVPSVDPFTADPCNGYAVTYRWTATDACGNEAVETVTFDVLPDNQDPVFDSAPAALADISCGQDLHTQEVLTATDNCNQITVVPSVDPFTADPCNGYAVTYRWTATDACGNEAVETVTFDVLPDNQDPVFDSAPAALVDLTCGQDLHTQEVLTATDNCGQITVVPSVDPFTADPCNGYAVTYRWTATDACGNEAVETVTFNVLPDNEDPTITNGPNELPDLVCGDPLPPQQILTADDNCGNTMITPSIDPFVVDECAGYTVTHRWVVMDDCQNMTTLTESFDVLGDNTAPTFNGPTDITLSCDQDPLDLTITGMTSDLVDNCDNSPSISFSDTENLNGCNGTGTIVRSWVSLDACGNESLPFLQTITIQDTTPPELTCQNISVNLDTDGNATIDASMLAASLTDNCSGNPTLELSISSFDCTNVGENTIVVTATDDCQQSISCNAIVTVVDVTPPTILCPDNYIGVIEGNASSLVVNNIAATANDLCGTATISYETIGATLITGAGDISGTAFNLGTTQVTYTATDESGNMVSCTFSVTINGSVNISCPDNFSMNAIEGNCSAVVENIGVVVTTGSSLVDNITYTLTGATTGSGNDDASGNIFNLGMTVVSYSVTDVDGNTIVCSFTVEVLDVQMPTLSCPDSQTFTLAPGQTAMVVNNLDPSASDLCSIVSISYELSGATIGTGTDSASGTTFEVGLTTITYTATDASGNMTSCSVNVNLLSGGSLDLIDCVNDVNLNNDTGQCTALVDDIAPVLLVNPIEIASISYDITGATTTSGTDDASGVDFAVGTSTVTYTATGTAGQIDVCSFEVNIADNESPVVNCPENVIVNVDSGGCIATIQQIAPTYSDNCAVAMVTYTITGATNSSGSGDASGTTFEIGQSTVEYIVMDEAGNISQCAFNILVEDYEDPIGLSCSDNISLIIAEGMTGQIIENIGPGLVVDNCGSATISYSLSGATSGTGLDDASGTFFNTGITTVNYTATDINGNEVSCNFTVAINDGTNSLICANSPVTQSNDPGVCGAVVNNLFPVITLAPGTYDKIAFVATGASEFADDGDASGLYYKVGNTLLTYSLYAQSEIVSQCEILITITDDEAPTVMNCPESVTLFANEDCVQTFSWTAPDFADNCGLANVNNPVANSGDEFPIGTTLIEYSAIDFSGNTTLCQFEITVIDNTAPTISELPDLTVEVDTENCGAIVNWNSPSFNDNCDDFLDIAASHNSGDFFEVGTTIVNYTATDDSGNSSNASFTITVLDKTPPVIFNCSPTNLVLTNIGDCQILATWDEITATDNCEMASFTISHPSGSMFSSNTTVTVIAVDVSGNVEQCSFDITVQDNTPPVVSIPDDVTVYATAADCETAYSWPAIMATDDCDIVLIETSVPNGSQFPIGTTEVTVSVKDAGNNETNGGFTVTVLDEISPTVDCPAPIIVREDGIIISDPDNSIASIDGISDCKGVSLAISPPTANDNCGQEQVVVTLFSGPDLSSPLLPGSYELVYRAVDASQNITDCSIMVTVQGLPTFTISGDPGVTGCVGDEIELIPSQLISNASINWTGPNLWTSSDLSPSITLASGSAGEYTLSYGTSNGCQSTASISIEVAEPPAVAITTNSPICTGELVLSATAALGSPPVDNWEWTGPCGFAGSGSEIVLPDFDADCAGEYSLSATSNAGCSTLESIMIEAINIPTPAITSTCDSDLCIGESCTIIGTEYLDGNVEYIWESDEGLVLPLSTNTHILTIEAELAGTFDISYMVMVDGCETESVNLSVVVNGNPDAIDDFFSVDFETELKEINVAFNDVAASSYDIQLIQPPSNGAISINADGTFDYAPGSGFIGEDQFTYEICQSCGDGSCDQATVRLMVDYEGECQIPTLITPNGDNVNDQVQILCLEDESYPDNSFAVYNQWGDVVFEASPYLNDWDGTLDGNAGQDLPDGTYYFTFSKGNSEPLERGFITIFR